MRRHFSFLLLAILVAGIFYPSISAESLPTDDQEMLRGYMNMTELDWQGLFLPSSSLYYYRPLLGFSFYCDHLLFDNLTSFAHLGNILLHLANTLLLYALLRSIVSMKENDSPLLMAIFFGIHPLATEPVNWISGRTDLLAGFFVLLSFLFFLRNQEKKPEWDLLAAFWFLCGLWSKEVAIGLLPVILFVDIQDEHFAIHQKWREITKRVTPFFAATLLYGLMRTGGQITHDVGIMSAIYGGHGAEHFPLSAKLLSLIKAIGFYSHKILWPFPLNFAIVEINRPLALGVGIIALVSLTVGLLFCRHRRFMMGIIWIPCFLAPALPVAVNRVAWTPLAERYLYLPLMGLCLTMAILMSNSSKKKSMVLAMSILLLGFGAATAQRNIVWQKNITLWHDVVENSPNFAPGHNDYALALLREGKTDEAKKHFAIAASLAEGTGKSLAKSNIAMLKGTSEQQLATLDAILQNEQSPKLRSQILYNIIRLVSNELGNKEITAAKQRTWTRKLLGCQEQLAVLEKNPYHLYRIGQLHLALGEKTAAKAAFETTCQTSNDYFTQPACTLAKRLAQETKGE